MTAGRQSRKADGPHSQMPSSPESLAGIGSSPLSALVICGEVFTFEYLVPLPPSLVELRASINSLALPERKAGPETETEEAPYSEIPLDLVFVFAILAAR